MNESYEEKNKTDRYMSEIPADVRNTLRLLYNCDPDDPKSTHVHLNGNNADYLADDIFYLQLKKNKWLYCKRKRKPLIEQMLTPQETRNSIRHYLTGESRPHKKRETPLKQPYDKPHLVMLHDQLFPDVESTPFITEKRMKDVHDHLRDIKLAAGDVTPKKEKAEIHYNELVSTVEYVANYFGKEAVFLKKINKQQSEKQLLRKANLRESKTKYKKIIKVHEEDNQNQPKKRYCALPKFNKSTKEFSPLTPLWKMREELKHSRNHRPLTSRKSRTQDPYKFACPSAEIAAPEKEHINDYNYISKMHKKYIDQLANDMKNNELISNNVNSQSTFGCTTQASSPATFRKKLL